MAKAILGSIVISIVLTLLANLLLGGMGFILFPFLFLPLGGMFFFGNRNKDKTEDYSTAHDISKPKRISE